jgi:copper chaperone CopZ
MNRVALGLALALGGTCFALARVNPLAAVALTAAQREAGLRTMDLEINGANCRFCRINVERTLKDMAGVSSARADMSRHRARVIYDPRLVQPNDLVAAVHGIGVGAQPAPDRPAG